MENKSNSRKLTMKDLVDDFDGDLDNSSNNKNYSYKIENNQKKYSHTQKIKPWRVGGHQQQIAPKGFKKGFRG